MRGQIQRVLSTRTIGSHWRLLLQSRYKSDTGNNIETPDNINPDESKTSEGEERVGKLLMNSVEEPEPEFPSDIDYVQKFRGYDTYDQWASSQKKHAYRPQTDLGHKSILLFPGQGSQFVGMGKKLLSYPNVTGMYETASKILGYDLLKLCLNGPKSQLDKTQYCQPAIFVTSLAAVEKLKEETPEAIPNCISAAGYSLGEIAALVFAGSLTFEDGVELVKVRGQAMQMASQLQPSGMLYVTLTYGHRVRFACHAAKLYCSEKLGMEKPVCEIASHIHSEGKVIGGNEEALNFIENTYEEFGLKECKRLPVSGAFHTKLMLPAGPKFEKCVDKLNIKLPEICVHSNVTSHRYKTKMKMKALLNKQLCKPIKWEQIMQILYTGIDNYPNTYGLGPGKQVGFMLRKINGNAFRKYHHVEV